MSVSSGAAWLPDGLSVCLSPTFGTLSRVPRGMLRWCCAGGNRAHQLADTSGGGRDEMDGAHEWASQREVEKKEKRKRRKEAKRGESQRRLVGWHQRAGVGGSGDGVQSLGLHQLLSGGGSLCTLFFFILSRYSCWDTASTDARISSSSQSFRPKAEGDICWMRARHSRAG